MMIGSRIKLARRARNMTQEQLAKRIGVDQSVVSKWEREPDRRPNRDIMPVLAEALGRSTAWLEGRRGADEDERGWSPPPVDASTATQINFELLSETVGAALRALLKPYGVEIPRHKVDDAAEAAVSAYLSYQRLENTDDAA
jgi:transcriptional regulator with XRE-family HTH domain